MVAADNDSPHLPASVRALAARLGAERHQVSADEMFDFIASALPEMQQDEKLACLAKGTCLGMVELTLAMIEHAIPADRAEAPVVAVEYAALAAERGLSLGDLLRTFRLGHACFGRILTDAIMDLDMEPTELASAVRESERFSFALVDVVSSRIGTLYIEECQRLHSRTVQQQRDVVRALLEGEAIDIRRAEKALGHRLTGPQMAFICWNDADTTALQRAVTVMQEALGAPQPVLLPFDDFVLSGWFDMSRRESLRCDVLAAAVTAAVPSTHVALGPVLPGLDGFRRSRKGAEGVRRVVDLSHRHPPTLTDWSSVSLVAALSADMDAMREIVRAELNSLTRLGDDAEMLRRTAQAFVASGYSYAAVASSLHVHRNTALQRVKKAQALRGRPLTERPAELLAALALVDAVGPSVLDG